VWPVTPELFALLAAVVGGDAFAFGTFQ